MQNSEREFVGQCCVNMHCEFTDGAVGEHNYEQVIDTIADVLHYAASLEMDPAAIVRTALVHLAAERGPTP